MGSQKAKDGSTFSLKRRLMEEEKVEKEAEGTQKLVTVNSSFKGRTSKTNDCKRQQENVCPRTEDVDPELPIEGDEIEGDENYGDLHTVYCDN